MNPWTRQGPWIFSSMLYRLRERRIDRWRYLVRTVTTPREIHLQRFPFAQRLFPAYYLLRRCTTTCWLLPPGSRAAAGSTGPRRRSLDLHPSRASLAAHSCNLNRGDMMAIVDTRDGKVEGLQHDGLHAFLGIPFAAPPVGAKRWRAPEAPKPWSGVRKADGFGRQAWQIMMDNAGPLSFAFNARESGNRDEDCLYLNVWTPGLDARKRPVLVWIHGGGFSAGTGGTPMYDGAALARRGDAVVVTINYRLGALGFLNLNEVTGGRIPATGNEGLLDQVMALEWVRDNIDAFGGDPRRVTIFGESAGGISVGALLAFAPAKGLFHRAIPQSGATSTAHPLGRSAQIAQGLIDRLGFSANDAVDRLMKLEPEQLITTAAMHGMAEGGMIFARASRHVVVGPADRRGKAGLRRRRAGAGRRHPRRMEVVYRDAGRPE